MTRAIRNRTKNILWRSMILGTTPRSIVCCVVISFGLLPMFVSLLPTYSEVTQATSQPSTRPVPVGPLRVQGYDTREQVLIALFEIRPWPAQYFTDYQLADWERLAETALRLQHTDPSIIRLAIQDMRASCVRTYWVRQDYISIGIVVRMMYDGRAPRNPPVVKKSMYSFGAFDFRTRRRKPKSPRGAWSRHVDEWGPEAPFEWRNGRIDFAEVGSCSPEKPYDALTDFEYMSSTYYPRLDLPELVAQFRRERIAEDEKLGKPLPRPMPQTPQHPPKQRSD